jgi:phosphomannomutase
MASFSMKTLIFDLDGTLAESKSPLAKPMGLALKNLLKKRKVAIISGGAWPQFESQILSRVKLTIAEKSNLYLMPTSGTSFYKFFGGVWNKVYSEDLNHSEISQIESAFNSLLADPNIEFPQKCWGDRLENRGTQVTFSVMGQNAPCEEKKSWDPTFSKRLTMIEKLSPLLKDFEIRTGGSTSIDVTRKGIDKSYGIKNLQKHLGISLEEMLFVGDALFPGGNDRAVYDMGVECISTSGPKFTLQIINGLLK